MKLYLSVIGVCMALIAAFNIVFETVSWYCVIISVVWCTVLQFVFDGAMAIMIRLMNDKYFGVDNPHFKVSARSRKLYASLGVRKWKDKVWELGGLGGFSKARLEDPKNPEYIEKFIIECNKGVVTHRLCYIAGFFAIFTVSGIIKLTVALPVAIVNLFLNILPTVVLRYNTPALMRVLSRMKKQKENISESIKHS